MSHYEESTIYMRSFGSYQISRADLQHAIASAGGDVDAVMRRLIDLDVLIAMSQELEAADLALAKLKAVDQVDVVGVSMPSSLLLDEATAKVERRRSRVVEAANAFVGTTERKATGLPAIAAHLLAMALGRSHSATHGLCEMCGMSPALVPSGPGRVAIVSPGQARSNAMREAVEAVRKAYRIDAVWRGRNTRAASMQMQTDQVADAWLTFTTTTTPENDARHVYFGPSLEIA